MNEKRSWLVIGALLALVVSGAVASTWFIRGYRPNLRQKLLEPTGLLAANSDPDGASVFINDKLVTATDDTINLVPGSYRIKIVKDGFLPWKKTIAIKKEVVKQTEAHLFRAAPDLKPITSTGAINPALSIDGAKVAYAVASASAKTKNGLWVNHLGSQTLNIARNNSQQLTVNTTGQDWSRARLTWSPDSKQVLAYFTNNKDEISAAYLLPVNRLTSPDQLRDVSFRLESIIARWQEEKNFLLQENLSTLPKQLQPIASQSARLISFSPNEERIFYLANKKTTIPNDLTPHPPARSDQPETRSLKPNYVYAYDLKEDTNFLIGNAQELGIDRDMLEEGKNLSQKLARLNYQPIYWLATSRHLIFIQNGKVKVVESDGKNKQTLFAGPFVNHFAYPWSDGTKLLILTSLYSDRPANLYAVTIK